MWSSIPLNWFDVKSTTVIKHRNDRNYGSYEYYFTHWNEAEWRI